MLVGCAVLVLAATSLSAVSGQQGVGYVGSYIGPLEHKHHQVSGEVFAVDSRTIHIQGFNYDGQGPDAYFYGGSSSRPDSSGFLIPNEEGTDDILGAYHNKDITLTLPEGKTLQDVRWITVWCKAFSVDFGSIKVPRGFAYPRPQKIGPFPSGEHAVSSDSIVVVDAQTFLIPNFTYDGAAPDAQFWVGVGERPGPEGVLIPDENGSELPLKRYERKSVVITLPGDKTVFDYDWLSVWCVSFYVDFSHVKIPSTLNVPPSLKMLGVAPQPTTGTYPSYLTQLQTYQLTSSRQLYGDSPTVAPITTYPTSTNPPIPPTTYSPAVRYVPSLSTVSNTVDDVDTLFARRVDGGKQLNVDRRTDATSRTTTTTTAFNNPALSHTQNYRASPAYSSAFSGPALTHRSPSIYTQTYLDPYRSPVYTQTYSNPAYTQTYNDPAYTETYMSPTYTQTANTQTVSNPAYTQTYSNPAYTQTYSNPAYTQTYSSPTFSQSFNLPTQTHQVRDPTYLSDAAATVVRRAPNTATAAAGSLSTLGQRSLPSTFSVRTNNGGSSTFTLYT